ncbi:MAG: hypothetical protein NC131_01645 [Roseburia sp.]|nr:hypothetical protein [Roseburia sp.]
MKKRSLIKVFLTVAIFLAVILAVILLPQSVQPAYAADGDVTVKLEHGNVKYRYTSGTVGNTSNATSYLYYPSDFAYSGSYAVQSQGAESNSFTIHNGVGKDYYSKAVYESFNISVTVPEGQKIAIRFKFQMSASRTQTSGDCSARAGYELFHFGTDDKSSELSFRVSCKSDTSASSVSSTYSVARNNTTSNSTASTGGQATYILTYDNKDGAHAKFCNYFGFFAYCGGTANRDVKLVASYSMTYEILETPLKVPTLATNLESISGNTYTYTAEYTGAEQTFYLQGLDPSVMSANFDYNTCTRVGETDYLTVSIAGSKCFWDDDLGGVDKRSICLKIVKGTPKVVVGKVSACTSLPAEVPIDTGQSTPGIISWTADATVDNPKWQYNVTDTTNYVGDTIYGVAEVEIKHTIDDESHVDGADATCTQGGSAEYWQCSVCEKYFSDSDGTTEIAADEIETDALGHYMTKTEAKSATCLAAGNPVYYTCSRCEKIFKDEDGDEEYSAEDIVTAKLDHAFSEEWETGADKHWHVCTLGCGTKDGEAAHTFEWKVDKAATVTSTGVKHEECSVCGYKRNENTEIEVVTCLHTDKTHHDRVDPTCVAKGTAEYWSCDDCGKNLNASGLEIGSLEIAVDPDAHSYNDGEITTAASCTEEGVKTYTCTACGDTYTEDVPVTGHTPADDGVAEPTCTETGLTAGSHCSVCNEVLEMQAVLPALGHDYAWVITKEPTEDETGLKQNICSRCGDTDGEEEIAKLVVDGGGSVMDLPVGNDYDLEIAVKESDSLYNIAGVSKGYKVELYVVDGETRTPYDADKTVTLMLVVPEGMQEFTLYRRSGDILEPISAEDYKLENNVISIRTTLPEEYVFNAPLAETPKSGIPWWVWLIVAISVIVLITLIVVIILAAKHKKQHGAVSVTADNGEVLDKLHRQDEKIDRLIEITDGGFNDLIDE